MKRIAYVTVTIPVGLDSDTPIERRDWWEEAAVQNFLDHPAIKGPAAHHEYLGMYVDQIRFEDTDEWGGNEIS
jgi:hypothetical protein